jgi:hypothetical protein
MQGSIVAPRETVAWRRVWLLGVATATLAIGVLSGMNKPALGTPAPAIPPSDFLLEWYKLHRQHEMELNKATLAYELEWAKLLLLLNGGAVGAFLTLTGAVWKDGPRPSFWLVAVAIMGWLIGLIAAAFATDCAYRMQKEYTRAYRFRRYGEELRRLKWVGLEPGLLGTDEDGPTAKAGKARASAEGWSKWVSICRWAAVVLFILGAISALAAFYPPLTSRPLVSPSYV